MGKYDQLNFKFQKGMFEEICESSTLYKAFKAVKKNKGAPGVDGVTIEEYETDLEANLKQLKRKLEQWTYKPYPVRRVEIPKPTGGVRLLGVPAVCDRVCQAAIKEVIEPILDPTFSESSFGFRPGRNQEQAVKKAKSLVQSGKEYVVDIDLSKFFDRINHDRLISRLGLFINDKRVLRLIGIILRSGVMINGLVTPSEEGSVQGGPLSPLLSNVVLDELDKELEKRNLNFCRFADDCNIFLGSEKAAMKAMENITRFIEKRLKLVINREKSKVAKSSYVKFLGMTILGGAIAISQIAMYKASIKLKELTPRGTHLPIEKSIKEINGWYNGWANYFKMTEYPSQFRGLEAHVRRRLRARIIRQQKSRRHLMRKLIKMGISKRLAGKTVYSNRKTWALSNTNAANRAWKNKWFIEKGQIIFSNRKLDHWKDIKEIPKFRS